MKTHVLLEYLEQDDLEDMSLLMLVQKAAAEQNVMLRDVTSISFSHTEVAFSRSEMDELLQACPKLTNLDLSYTYFGGDPYIEWLVEWSNQEGNTVTIIGTWRAVQIKERLVKRNRLKRPSSVIVEIYA